MAQLTKKQQRLKDYNDIIMLNRKSFKAGTTLTRRQFTKMFNIKGVVHKGNYKDVHKSNLILLKVQADVNALMRENGLYLKSKNYYGEFSIVNKSRVKSTVARFSKEVDVYRACTNRLITNVEKRTNAGTWGTYRRVPLASISKMGEVSDSKRHLRTIKRLHAI